MDGITLGAGRGRGCLRIHAVQGSLGSLGSLGSPGPEG